MRIKIMHEWFCKINGNNHNLKSVGSLPLQIWYVCLKRTQDLKRIMGSWSQWKEKKSSLEHQKVITYCTNKVISYTLMNWDL